MGGRDLKGARDRVEANFNKAQTTMDKANAESAAQLQTICRKTAGLKAERLAKEAGERQSELDNKPRAKKRWADRDTNP
jgi:hypothetical protein